MTRQATAEPRAKKMSGSVFADEVTGLRVWDRSSESRYRAGLYRLGQWSGRTLPTS
jgi:hypothetical protein